MTLPAIEECAKQVYNLWRKAHDTEVRWHELDENTKDKYRDHVRIVYTAINRISLHTSED